MLIKSNVSHSFTCSLRLLFSRRVWKTTTPWLFFLFRIQWLMYIFVFLFSLYAKIYLVLHATHPFAGYLESECRGFLHTKCIDKYHYTIWSVHILGFFTINTYAHPCKRNYYACITQKYAMPKKPHVLPLYILGTKAKCHLPPNNKH